MRYFSCFYWVMAERGVFLNYLLDFPAGDSFPVFLFVDFGYFDFTVFNMLLS